jgi:hypothetical protein
MYLYNLLGLSAVSVKKNLCPHHQGHTVMGTEMVPEMSIVFNQVLRLIAREDFFNFSRRESFSQILLN